MLIVYSQLTDLAEKKKNKIHELRGYFLEHECSFIVQIISAVPAHKEYHNINK